MSKAIHSGKTNPQWFPEHPATWREETHGISHEEKGIYADLRAIYWINGCSLPADREILKRKLGIRAGDDDSALSSVMAEFFPDGQNAFLDKALSGAKEFSAKQAARASAGHAKKSHPSAPVSAPVKSAPVEEPPPPDGDDNPEDF
jgi:uncharacterized protein YdaU (DUF1376 family)